MPNGPFRPPENAQKYITSGTFEHFRAISGTFGEFEPGMPGSARKCPESPESAQQRPKAHYALLGVFGRPGPIRHLAFGT
eukprot:12485477-Alexandrium_andersonii.AAC.1